MIMRLVAILAVSMFITNCGSNGGGDSHPAAKPATAQTQPQPNAPVNSNGQVNTQQTANSQQQQPPQVIPALQNNSNGSTNNSNGSEQDIPLVAAKTEVAPSGATKTEVAVIDSRAQQQTQHRVIVKDSTTSLQKPTNLAAAPAPLAQASSQSASAQVPINNNSAAKVAAEKQIVNKQAAQSSSQVVASQPQAQAQIQNLQQNPAPLSAPIASKVAVQAASAAVQTSVPAQTAVENKPVQLKLADSLSPESKAEIKKVDDAKADKKLDNKKDSKFGPKAEKSDKKVLASKDSNKDSKKEASSKKDVKKEVAAKDSKDKKVLAKAPLASAKAASAQAVAPQQTVKLAAQSIYTPAAKTDSVRRALVDQKFSDEKELSANLADTSSQQKRNAALNERIEDVKVVYSKDGQASLKIRIKSKGDLSTVVSLSGKLDLGAGKADLKPQDNTKVSASLQCVDQDPSSIQLCETAALKINFENVKGQKASAYAIVRKTQAQYVAKKSDATDSSSEFYKRLSDVLSNSANISRLDIETVEVLGGVSSGSVILVTNDNEVIQFGFPLYSNEQLAKTHLFASQLNRNTADLAAAGLVNLKTDLSDSMGKGGVVLMSNDGAGKLVFHIDSKDKNGKDEVISLELSRTVKAVGPLKAL